METLESQLVRHEGYRNLPYEDSEGIITIGVGHNMEAKPVADDIIQRWFQEDLQEARDFLYSNWPWIQNIDETRRDAFLNMAFNLGSKLKGFRNMFSAAKKGEWNQAAAEALDSLWAKQVGDRAIELAEQIKTGRRK